MREQHAEAEADRGAEQAEDQGLDQHRPRHLPPRGPHRAQQGELAAALGDQDREGVDDQEGPDDQRDPGEDQQERGDEARSPPAASLARLVGRLVAGDRLDVVGQDLARRRRASSSWETPSSAVTQTSV